jgi:hypothetical protein
MAFVLSAAGTLIVLVLCWDAFITVFHPEGRGGPVNRVQRRVVWGAFRAVGRRRDGSTRDTLLGYAGPVVAVLTPTVWMALLIVGCAMIYYPWIQDFLYSPGAMRTPWLEALYFSGYAASTMGLGDLTPDHEPLRALSVVQSVMGFALLTASLTYILAVYREVVVMNSLALEIRARLPDHAPVPVLESDRQQQEWDAWFAHVMRILLQSRQAFGQYPILHYFRPADRSNALSVQLGKLIAVRALLEDDHAQLAETPAFRGFSRGIDLYLQALTLHVLPNRRTAGQRPLEELSRSEAEALHGELIDYLLLA